MAAPADLACLPWLQEAGTNESYVWLRSLGIDPDARSSVLHAPGMMMLEAIRRGEGIGVVARALIGDDIATGRLAVLLEDEVDPALGYHLIHRPGPHRSALKAFILWARREAAQSAC